METPEAVIEQAKPFFQGYCQNLSEHLTSMTTVPVVCTLVDVSLLRGADDLAPIFADDRSVAYAEEDADGLGDLHLIFDTPLSIALAGTLMMTDAAIIQEKMQSREYDEETHEGFREVSTQIVASLNKLLEEKLAQDAHFYLENFEQVSAGLLPKTLSVDTTYLMVNVEVVTSDYPAVTAYWLISRKFAATILKTSIPASAAETAREAALIEVVEEDITAIAASQPGGVITPEVAGGVRSLMTLPPFSLRADEPVKHGILAVTQDHQQYIGIVQKGALIRVLSRSDIQQVMGPFHGGTAPTPRDRALYMLPIGKINTQQMLVKIFANGTINEAAELMREHKLHALPVVSSLGVLRGFVPIHAVVDYFRKRGERQ